MDRITKEIEVEIKPSKAFQKFLDELNNWWPKEYTWSKNKLQKIYIEGKENGRCTEIGPYGFQCDWGRVTAIIPGQKIELKWQISPKREPIPNPDNASDIKVTFKQDGDATTLKFEHLHFKNHGDDAENYQKIMDSEQGWDYILNCYKEYCDRK